MAKWLWNCSIKCQWKSVTNKIVHCTQSNMRFICNLLIILKQKHRFPYSLPFESVFITFFSLIYYIFYVLKIECMTFKVQKYFSISIKIFFQSFCVLRYCYMKCVQYVTRFWGLFLIQFYHIGYRNTSDIS